MPVMETSFDSRDLEILKEAAREGRKAKEAGNHPFGAVLADADRNIILTAGNTVNTEKNACGHAETNLVIAASKEYSVEFLKSCTLYTSVEPCAMCAGAIYWADVRRVVFAMSEERLLELTGGDPENMTMSLPCREVFSRGQKEITVIGPVEEKELIEFIVADHRDFWTR